MSKLIKFKISSLKKMSWANIRIPRKRDISQIPEDFRPVIIPRVQRPEVISSESFRTIEKPIYDNSGNSYDNSYDNSKNTKKTKNTKDIKEYEPRQYITKKIDTNVSSFELSFKGKSYVFVILRNIRTVRDNDLWISSYNSIRKFYKNKIVIIDDNSTINTVDGKLINTDIIKSEFNGAGEVLPYYYFLKYKWADRMIFLHDTMFINRKFKDSELDNDIKFHWHFVSNGYDDYRKITNYISLLKNNKELLAFAADPNEKWRGCFGGASIVDLTKLEYLEEEYGIFTSLALVLKTRKDRETFERLLGIVLYYEGMMDNDCSNFGDILSYPETFNPQNNMETSSYILGQRGYDTAIIKVWRGR